jgi:hypothetical protein
MGWKDNIKIDAIKKRVELWASSFGSGQRPVVSSCERGSKPLGLLRGGRYID